jgi:H+/Cl- antiporter ClcA
MATPDPLQVMRGREYRLLLVLAAVLGVPVAAVAWGFLALVSKLQGWLYTSLPTGLGFHGTPVWWPLPLLAVAGVLVASCIRYLPGTGGHSPADGLARRPAPRPVELPGVFLAALATLSLGAVLGPEAPLIALGGGLAAWLLHLIRRAAPAQASTLVAAAGTFAAISTLLGSPLLAALLLMEMAGLGGAALTLVLLPGLLAAGVGALIIIGLGSWSGLGSFSLAIPNLPHFARPNVAEFGWAIVIGVAAALAGSGIRRLALLLRPHIEGRILATMVIGLVVGGLAIAFAEGTGKSPSEVLYSGQAAVGPLVVHASGYTVGALVLLLACKGLGYGLSMSGFRGGPVFPALFLGAAGGIALSHLPGLPLVPAVAMGLGGMSVAMLQLPVTSVALATLLLFSDGIAVTPLVIVAVVVAYLVTLRIGPHAAPQDATQPGAASLRNGHGGPVADP